MTDHLHYCRVIAGIAPSFPMMPDKIMQGEFINRVLFGKHVIRSVNICKSVNIDLSPDKCLLGKELRNVSVYIHLCLMFSVFKLDECFNIRDK